MVNLDTGIIGLVIHFAINVISCALITYVVYVRRAQAKSYDFSFMMIATIIFFLCFFLSSVDLQLGMALGLFAIFGIIRYRTDAMPVREMTFLFLMIALSLINALIPLCLELGLVNIIFVVMPLIIEGTRKGSRKEFKVVYNNIDNLNKSNRSKLKRELQEKLHIKIAHIRIDKIDMVNNKATLTVTID